MSLIQIDESTCKKDALCAKECPAVIIQLKDKDSFPQMVEGGEALCLHCGHCVAVCPHDAFHHISVPQEKSPLLVKELALGSEQATQFLRSRRSIRRFKNKPVEQETIQSLIDTARYAPTGSNSQLINWTVHTDQEKIDQIIKLTVDHMREVVNSGDKSKMAPYMPFVIAAYDAGRNPVTHYAPVLLFASAPGGYRNGVVDVSITLSYLELAALSSGVGTCWLGIITFAAQSSEALRKEIGLPPDHKYFYGMVMGYPKYKYHRMPERNPAVIQWR